MDDWKKLDLTAVDEQSKADEEFLKKMVVGQDRAIRRVVESLMLFRTPFKQPDKPIGAFLWLGPTGSGKTRLAEAVAERFYHDRNALVRIDCSVLNEAHLLSSLTGTSHGYIGYNDNYKLSQKSISAAAFEVLNNNKDLQQLWQAANTKTKKFKTIAKDKKTPPNEKDKLAEEVEEAWIRYNLRRVKELSNLPLVILFDEVERAHPDLFNLLISILNRASLAMANGEKTDFSNALLIMTSNIGVEEIERIRRRIGFAPPPVTEKEDDEIYHTVMPKVRKIIGGALAGRLGDNITVFHSLKPEHLWEILNIQINELNEEFQKYFVISVTKEVRKFIFESAHHHENGARIIEDKIKKYIRMPLSQLWVTGQLHGKEALEVDLENGEICVRATSNLLLKNVRVNARLIKK